MKRIFIAIHYLEIGGAERSLIGLLNALDYRKYAVDLFVYQHKGEFMKLIPNHVNLLPEIGSYAAIEKSMVQALKEGYIGVVLARLLAKFQYSRHQKKHNVQEQYAIFQYVADYVTPLLPSLKKYGEYDLAISFLTPHNIVRDKVKAKKKLAWIHTDYSFVGINGNIELPVWDAFDKIISISEDVTKGFLSKFPSLERKIVLMENILSEQFVREQAHDSFEQISIELKSSSLEKSSKLLYLNLLSVGRFTYQKNFESIPLICKLIVEKGISIRWYLVGYGGDEALIRKNIVESGMQDYCIILGKKENPYPYMKACDVYIQPSRYEGKAVTVREAQILCKPVVITNYPTASSQVKDGVDGIIVPNDIEGAAEGIASFLKDKQKQQQIIDYLQTHHYGNENEVKKLDELI